MFGKLISSASLRACVLTAVAAVGVTGSIAGAGTYTVIPVDPAGPNPWLGFMNVFELDNTTYAFGSPWGTADLTAEFTGPVLTLGPNSIGDPDPYWYIGGGGPGAQGNKMMHASMYREMGAVEAGQNLTFQGTVLADTFAQGYDVTVFIKDFAPDYASNITTTIPLPSSGNFSLTALMTNDPARHFQFGFETVGRNVWSTDRAPIGNVQVTAFAVPEPTTLGVIGAAGMLLARRRRA